MGLFSPKNFHKQIKRFTKKPGKGGVAQTLLGMGQVDMSYQEYKRDKKVDEREDLADIAEGEAAVIAAGKLTKAKTKLDAQRKMRKSRAGKKGRRASIASGALGAGAEPEVRRAGVLGMN